MRGTLTRHVNVVIGSGELVEATDTGDGFVTVRHQVTTRIPTDWFRRRIHRFGGLDIELQKRYTIVFRHGRYGRPKQTTLKGYLAVERYGELTWVKNPGGPQRYVSATALVSVVKDPE